MLKLFIQVWVGRNYHCQISLFQPLRSLLNEALHEEKYKEATIIVIFLLGHLGGNLVMGCSEVKFKPTIKEMREKEKCVNFINGAPNSHIQLNNNNKKSTTTYP